MAELKEQLAVIKALDLEQSSTSTEPHSAKGKATHLDDPVADLSGSKIDATKRGVLSVTRSMLTEGHTAWDAFLSTASSAVGQVILVLPGAMANTGIIAGVILQIGTGLLNFYTLWLLFIIYLHRKQKLLQTGEWYDTHDKEGYRRRKTTTQFHDIIGWSLGPHFAVFAQIANGVYIFGVAIAQLIASATSQYAINKTHDKRDWGLILSPVLLVFCYLPNFRSVRLLNIIALVGTNYSCLYFLITAANKGITPGIFTRGPAGLRQFFLGSAILATGSHSISIEMMDAMRQSRKFEVASFLAWVWNIILLVPHTIAVVLAYPKQSLKQANVYSILPSSGFKTVSVYMMLIHNISAMTLHTNPLLYYTEKLLGTHTSDHYWKKALSRTPMLALIWFFAMLFPFYGTMNSMFNAFTSAFIGYVLPCLAFNWLFRTKQARDECPIRIHKWLTVWDWKLLFAANYFLTGFFLVTSFGFGSWASISQLISNINTFKVFAKCYQCAGST